MQKEAELQVVKDRMKAEEYKKLTQIQQSENVRMKEVKRKI